MKNLVDAGENLGQKTTKGTLRSTNIEAYRSDDEKFPTTPPPPKKNSGVKKPVSTSHPNIQHTERRETIDISEVYLTLEPQNVLQVSGTKKNEFFPQ